MRTRLHLALAGLMATVCLLTPLTPTVAQTQREWMAVDPNQPPGTPAQIRFDAMTSDPSHSFFDVFISGFWMEQYVGPDGRLYTMIEVPGIAPCVNQVGAPHLPAIRQQLAIATDATDVRLGQTFFDVFTIPSFGLVSPVFMPGLDDPEGRPPRFVRDEAIYGSSGFWPPVVGQAQRLTVWRGSIPSALVEVYPVRWDPATGNLGVARRARYEFNHTGMLRTSRMITKERVRLAEKTFFNWEVVSQFFPGNLVFFEGDYLIVTPEEYRNAIIPLRNQKSARGYRVQIETIPLSGNTCASIEAVIDAWYAATPPERDHYCLLVGDTSVIPFCTSPAIGTDYPAGVDSDDPYFSTDGLNLTKEIYGGRLSADDSTDVSMQVTKWLDYMDTPSMFFDYGREVLVAHLEGAPGKYEGAQEDVRTYGGYAVMPTFITQYGSNAAVSNATCSAEINAGVGWVCYRGHGNSDAWTGWNTLGESYARATVDGLTNTEAPIVLSYACQNGAATVEDCISEHWLERPANNGGVAHYGATVNSYTSINHELDFQTHMAFFREQITKLGPAFAWAEDETGLIAGDSNNWMYWLDGDPDLDARLEAPISLMVVLPEFIPISIDPVPIEFQILDQGQPVPGGLGGAFKPGTNLGKVGSGVDRIAAAEVFDNRYADANGMVSLMGTPSTPGWIYVAARILDGPRVGAAVFDSIEVVDPTDARSFVGPLTFRAIPSVTVGQTQFAFGRPLDQSAIVQVYDVTGCLIRTLSVPVAATAIGWDSRDRQGVPVPAGIYFARLRFGAADRRTRLVVVR